MKIQSRIGNDEIGNAVTIHIAASEQLGSVAGYKVAMRRERDRTLSCDRKADNNQEAAENSYDSPFQHVCFEHLHLPLSF